jgi:seryl-tRNA synthetase
MSTRKKYDDAKSKVDSYKTVRDQKRKEAQERRQAAKENYDQRKQDAVNQINEFKKDAKNKVKEIKTQVKNQLEELLDIYKQILPSGGGSNGLSTLHVCVREIGNPIRSAILLGTVALVRIAVVFCQTHASRTGPTSSGAISSFGWSTVPDT